MEYKSIKLCELKSDMESGSFEGYASTFGNIDLVGDVVLKGAFNGIEGKTIKLLYQHDTDKPIGILSAKQDDIGLFVKGEINLDVQLGREVKSLMKQGALDAMSIGFITSDWDYDNKNVRQLKKLDLKEVSIVTFPANELALITSVKSNRESIKNERDFERTLRDLGFSKKEAVAITLHGFKSVFKQGEPDEDELTIKFLNKISEGIN